MKNFKQLALGLLAGAIAIGFSAFTTNHTAVAKQHKFHKIDMISEDFIVQPTLDQFRPDASGTVANCADESNKQCVYEVNEDGHANIPEQSSYTETEINTYLSNSWIAAKTGSSNGLYEP